MLPAFRLPSALTALDAVCTIDVPSSWPHCYLTIQFYDGETEVDAASAGTLGVQFKAPGSGSLEDPPVATIDATAPVTISWESPTVQVVLTPAALADVTHYIATFSAYQS